jgi:hypothetical protein
MLSPALMLSAVVMLSPALMLSGYAECHLMVSAVMLRAVVMLTTHKLSLFNDEYCYVEYCFAESCWYAECCHHVGYS